MTTETYEIIAAGLRSKGIHRPDYHTASVQYAQQCKENCIAEFNKTNNSDEKYVLSDFITKWRRIVGKLSMTWGETDGRGKTKGRSQRKAKKSELSRKEYDEKQKHIPKRSEGKPGKRG